MLAGNIASAEAKAQPGSDSRHVQLKLWLKEVPDVLVDYFDASDRSVAMISHRFTTTPAIDMDLTMSGCDW